MGKIHLLSSEVSNKILELTKGKVDLIVLAGYLSILLKTALMPVQL